MTSAQSESQEAMTPALLTQWIEEEVAALAAAVPGDGEAAVHALLNARRRPDEDVASRRTVTGLPIVHPGLDLAIELVLSTADITPDVEPDDAWADSFLRSCNAVATARMTLAHVESGFMKLGETSSGEPTAWISTKLAPVRWRELSAWTRWATWNNGLAEVERPTDSSLLFSYQFGYPAESTLFGYKASDWTQMVGRLFELAESADAEPISVTETGLVNFLAERLKVKPEGIAARLPYFILDAVNAAWHASPPAIAAPPLIRVGENQLVISPHGVWMAPLMFLTREMRRRDGTIYHNAAVAREDLFRREMYALFPESRFVTARNRVLLRKPEGEARTDIDAAIFDKKTGTLAVFELKALDPFARSTAELHRQRDSTLDAGHQISIIVDWINRQGADEILKRIDPGSAKKFKVQRVLPFVLGRCAARFDDGPQPEARAAWSDWPDFMQHVESVAETNATNPLLSLHQRLQAITPIEIDISAFSRFDLTFDSNARKLFVFPGRGSMIDGAEQNS
jgi:hypothetical protein